MEHTAGFPSLHSEKQQAKRRKLMANPRGGSVRAFLQPVWPPSTAGAYVVAAAAHARPGVTWEARPTQRATTQEEKYALRVLIAARLLQCSSGSEGFVLLGIVDDIMAFL